MSIIPGEIDVKRYRTEVFRKTIIEPLIASLDDIDANRLLEAVGHLANIVQGKQGPWVESFKNNYHDLGNTKDDAGFLADLFRLFDELAWFEVGIKSDYYFAMPADRLATRNEHAYYPEWFARLSSIILENIPVEPSDAGTFQNNLASARDEFLRPTYYSIALVELSDPAEWARHFSRYKSVLQAFLERAQGFEGYQSTLSRVDDCSWGLTGATWIDGRENSSDNFYVETRPWSAAVVVGRLGLSRRDSRVSRLRDARNNFELTLKAIMDLNDSYESELEWLLMEESLLQLRSSQFLGPIVYQADSHSRTLRVDLIPIQNRWRLRITSDGASGVTSAHLVLEDGSSESVSGYLAIYAVLDIPLSADTTIRPTALAITIRGQ